MWEGGGFWWNSPGFCLVLLNVSTKTAQVMLLLVKLYRTSFGTKLLPIVP